MQIDIKGYTFDEFIAFVFQREAPIDPDPHRRKDPWYWSTELEYNPAEISHYYVRLFSEPEFLRDAYSTPQLEQGSWAIQSCNLDCSVAQIIWHEDLPFSVREQCVRSMFDLFERLFAFEPLDTAVEMWWDSLCYDWHCGNRKRENGGEDRLMQDVMFETLSRILSLPSEYCWGAALHGLGHLHHPLTNDRIAEFIANNPTLSEEAKNYALAAARFEVM